MIVMKLVGLASGMASPDEGRFLESYDPDAYGGRGRYTTTSDERLALRFPDPHTALEFWRQQSKVRRFREDGQPNRPLTAYTVELVSLRKEE